MKVIWCQLKSHVAVSDFYFQTFKPKVILYLGQVFKVAVLSSSCAL